MSNLFKDFKKRMVDNAKKVNEDYLAEDMNSAYLHYGACRAYAEVLIDLGHEVRIETDMSKPCFINYIVCNSDVIMIAE